jgi:hypothetical protein
MNLADKNGMEYECMREQTDRQFLTEKVFEDFTLF